MALSARVEAWVQEVAAGVYDRWCNTGTMHEAMVEGLRAAYLRGRADQRDGFREEGDPLEAVEAEVDGR